MLDLNHPQTPHIFAAARLEDSLLARANRMVKAGAAERHGILNECDPFLASLRNITKDHLNDSPSIHEALDEFHADLERLAWTEVPELNMISESRAKLGSAGGFCTEFI